MTTHVIRKSKVWIAQAIPEVRKMEKYSKIIDGYGLCFVCRVDGGMWMLMNMENAYSYMSVDAKKNFNLIRSCEVWPEAEERISAVNDLEFTLSIHNED